MLLEKVISFIFPLSLLEGTPWLGAWKEKEQKDFVALARVFFPIAAAVWLGHFFVFDLAMGLEPITHWLVFRLAMTSIAIAVTLYYLSPLAQRSFYRLPAVCSMIVFCYFQARVTVWYPDAPWLYCFLFVGISSIVLQTSVLRTIAYALAAMAAQWASLLEANLPLPTALSAGLVTLILILASRSGYAADIRYFLLSQQNLDAQRRNIEMNIEFTDRIKSFIPGEIASRLEQFISEKNATVLQAIDEVLRPRKRKIACIFSDIRGFTESSKEIDSFLGERVLPNVKACTNAVDQNNGIPRKIGDLIFAYYDSEDLQRNIESAVLTAFQISEINESLSNGSDGGAIERYILVASGDALVGNIGGFDSSIEITALGSPVNYLARLDDATKHPNLRTKLKSGDIVIEAESFLNLGIANSDLDYREIDLSTLGIAVRNFPEQTKVFVLTPTKENSDRFLSFIEQRAANDGSSRNSKPNQAA
ncbi:MAG: hypothetical protein AAGG11_12030 [Pseudomonadota bacterium]